MFITALVYINEHTRTSGGFPDAERIHMFISINAFVYRLVFIGIGVFITALVFINEHTRTSGGFSRCRVHSNVVFQ